MVSSAGVCAMEPIQPTTERGPAASSASRKGRKKPRIRQHIITSSVSSELRLRDMLVLRQRNVAMVRRPAAALITESSIAQPCTASSRLKISLITSTDSSLEKSPAAANAPAHSEAGAL